jgi:hypothetical protein
MSDIQKITSKVVAEKARMSFVDNLMGLSYVLIYEPAVFQFAEILSESYDCGYWDFISVSNGAFYMVPRDKTTYAVSSENGFEGNLSHDAFGIVVALFSYSSLSFSKGAFAEICARQYYLLRDFACQHKESRSILAAID